MGHPIARNSWRMTGRMTGRIAGRMAGRMTGRRLARSRAAVYALAVAAMMAFAGAGSALGDTPAIFTVTDVAVDVTANAAATARAEALATGQRAALESLLRRLTLRLDHADLPTVGDDEVADFVKDFEVAAEKASTVRYLATLTVRFKPSAIRSLLSNHGIPFAVTASKPVLVLPVLRSAGANILWDRANVWRAAWDGLVRHDGLVPLVLPRGDLADVAAISAEQAIAGKAEPLRRMERAYATGGVLVALAQLRRQPGAAAPRIDITLARHGSALQERTIVESFQAGDDESEAAFLTRVALALAARVEEGWKRDNLVRFDREMRVVVVTPVTKLADWLGLRRRLAEISFVRRSDLVFLSRREAHVALYFQGDETQLALALAQRDLELARGDGEDDNPWVLTIRRDAPGDGR